jgi:hypothetical protein
MSAAARASAASTAPRTSRPASRAAIVPPAPAIAIARASAVHAAGSRSSRSAIESITGRGTSLFSAISAWT